MLIGISHSPVACWQDKSVADVRRAAHPSALLALLLQAGVTRGGELLLELVDATGRVDELQLAGEERMAVAANVDLKLRTGAAGGERVATAASDLRVLVVGMDAFLHDGACELRGLGSIGG